MFKRFKLWLVSYQKTQALATKIKLHTKQDSFIYPWYHDQKD